MMNWKATAGAAIFAAAISFLAGLIRGNPFGVILVRLLLSSVLLGGLAAAAQAVLKRYLPELLEPRPSEEAEPAAAGRPIVDIMLPEENPHTDGPEAGTEPFGPAVEGLEGAEGPGAGWEEPAVVAPMESGPMDGGPGSAEPASGAAAALFGLGTEPEELEAALEEEEPGSGLEGGVESLPEIDRLDVDFRADGFRPKPASGRLEHGMQGRDPLDMARAVRTFLNKDQER